MRLLDVWVNCPDDETADRIADALVASRLAACANIFPPVRSVYRWKGAVERESEVPLLLKTRSELFGKVCSRVRELHPYEVPSIVASVLEEIDETYAAWLREETEEPV